MTAIELDELEHDALTELLNIAVSRAAANLRKMVGHPVLLSVPLIEIVHPAKAAALIRERESEALVAVRQDFEGAFSGRALLIFPEARSLELVRAVTDAALSEAEAREMETEALSETGNVVLNGCLATMANMLRKPLSMSLPRVLRGDGAAFFERGAPANGEGVTLFLYINFEISRRDVRGYMALVMDLPSLESLRRLVREFIERVAGGDAHAG